MILLIDNYDSFVFNLYQHLGSLDPDVRVIRNDELNVKQIAALRPSHIVLSPGPGRPADAGVCQDVVRELSSQVPILGVCLGHQAICEALGATVGYAKTLMHGKRSEVRVAAGANPLAPDALFDGLGPRFEVARYHSLAVDADTLPPELLVTAIAEDGEVMAVRHAHRPLHGVQFHPESIMTPDGMRMLANFLEEKPGTQAANVNKEGSL